MDDVEIKDDKLDFLEEVVTKLGVCQCANPNCGGVIFETAGPSGYTYQIDYDPSPKGFSNLLISLKKEQDVVFNGRCNDQHDIAQILRMVII